MSRSSQQPRRFCVHQFSNSQILSPGFVWTIFLDRRNNSSIKNTHQNSDENTNGGGGGSISSILYFNLQSPLLCICRQRVNKTNMINSISKVSTYFTRRNIFCKTKQHNQCFPNQPIRWYGSSLFLFKYPSKKVVWKSSKNEGIEREKTPIWAKTELYTCIAWGTISQVYWEYSVDQVLVPFAWPHMDMYNMSWHNNRPLHFPKSKFFFDEHVEIGTIGFYSNMKSRSNLRS